MQQFYKIGIETISNKKIFDNKKKETLVVTIFCENERCFSKELWDNIFSNASKVFRQSDKNDDKNHILNLSNFSPNPEQKIVFTKLFNKDDSNQVDVPEANDKPVVLNLFKIDTFSMVLSWPENISNDYTVNIVKAAQKHFQQKNIPISFCSECGRGIGPEFFLKCVKEITDTGANIYCIQARLSLHNDALAPNSKHCVVTTLSLSSFGKYLIIKHHSTEERMEKGSYMVKITDKNDDNELTGKCINTFVEKVPEYYSKKERIYLYQKNKNFKINQNNILVAAPDTGVVKKEFSFMPCFFALTKYVEPYNNGPIGGSYITTHGYGDSSVPMVITIINNNKTLSYFFANLQMVNKQKEKEENHLFETDCKIKFQSEYRL